MKEQTISKIQRNQHTHVLQKINKRRKLYHSKVKANKVKRPLR